MGECSEWGRDVLDKLKARKLWFEVGGAYRLSCTQQFRAACNIGAGEIG